MIKIMFFCFVFLFVCFYCKDLIELYLRMEEPMNNEQIDCNVSQEETKTNQINQINESPPKRIKIDPERENQENFEINDHVSAFTKTESTEEGNECNKTTEDLKQFENDNEYVDGKFVEHENSRRFAYTKQPRRIARDTNSQDNFDESSRSSWRRARQSRQVQSCTAPVSVPEYVVFHSTGAIVRIPPIRQSGLDNSNVTTDLKDSDIHGLFSETKVWRTCFFLPSD